MTEVKTRKCVIKEKRGSEFRNSYVSGVATSQSGLYNAQIFDESKIPEFMKNDSYRYEVIYLDSKEGMELLSGEFEFLDGRISQVESELHSLNNGREKLFNANPEMISEYISEHNRLNHPLMGISKDTKERIIERIISKNKNNGLGKKN